MLFSEKNWKIFWQFFSEAFVSDQRSLYTIKIKFVYKGFPTFIYLSLNFNDSKEFRVKNFLFFIVLGFIMVEIGKKNFNTNLIGILVIKSLTSE